MLTPRDRERIEELDAKAYFEWGLNEEDSKELDLLIAKANTK